MDVSVLLGVRSDMGIQDIFTIPHYLHCSRAFGHAAMHGHTAFFRCEARASEYASVARRRSPPTAPAAKPAVSPRALARRRAQKSYYAAAAVAALAAQASVCGEGEPAARCGSARRPIGADPCCFEARRCGAPAPDASPSRADRVCRAGSICAGAVCAGITGRGVMQSSEDVTWRARVGAVQGLRFCE